MNETMAMPDLSNYSLEQFGRDIESVKPRAMDTYVLPVFLIAFAVKSGKKPMGKISRRILFGAGIYMFYRNFVSYKQAAIRVKEVVSAMQSKGGNDAPA